MPNKTLKSVSAPPSTVGARVIGGTIGLAFLLFILLFGVILPLILLATYYYTLNLVKGMENNPECKKCISGDYMCNQVLRYTPLPLIIIMVFNMLVNLTNVPVHVGIKSFVALINFVMYVWFVFCLYKNTQTLTKENCPCVEGNEIVVSRLRFVSQVLAFLLLFSLVTFLLGVVTILLTR